MEDSLALLQQPNDALAINRAPELVLEEARKAAKALTDVIEGKEKKLVFNGKTYIPVRGLADSRAFLWSDCAFPLDQVCRIRGRR